jgi:hypothetical protein
MAIAIWSSGVLLLAAVTVALGAPITVGRSLVLLAFAALPALGLLWIGPSPVVLTAPGPDRESDRSRVASRLLDIQRTRSRDDAGN